MTTNLPGMQTGRNNLGRIAQAARNRAQAVREGLEALDGQEEDVRIGAAALLQDIDNERAPLTEEGEQLLAILSAGQQRQQPQATQPAPAAPLPIPAIVEQTPAPAAPIVTQVQPQPLPAPPAQVHVVPEIEEEEEEQEPEPPATRRVNVPNIHHPSWGRGARVGAYIGFFIAFLVSVNSRGWLADLADLNSGFSAWAIKAAWIFAITAFGYYAAGFITSTAMSRASSINPRT